jgi:hypothetical protein
MKCGYCVDTHTRRAAALISAGYELPIMPSRHRRPRCLAPSVVTVLGERGYAGHPARQDSPLARRQEPRFVQENLEFDS